MEPRIHQFRAPDAFSEKGHHVLSYTEWGDAANPHAVLCLHGLSRNARDFDFLARELSGHYRVICPDIAGRGKSEWLRKHSHYTYTAYVADIIALLDHLQLHSVSIIGTSMGGIIAVLIAAHYPYRVQKLVVNDIGPFVPGSALKRIFRNVKKSKSYKTFAEAEQVFREKFASFGIQDERHWQHLLTHSITQDDKGEYIFTYDPHIIKKPLLSWLYVPHVKLWDIWDKVSQPMLLLRGSKSDILPKETAEELQHKRPDIKIVEFSGIGHAPALMEEEQIQVVKEWLG